MYFCMMHVRVCSMQLMQPCLHKSSYLLLKLIYDLRILSCRVVRVHFSKKPHFVQVVCCFLCDATRALYIIPADVERSASSASSSSPLILQFATPPHISQHPLALASLTQFAIRRSLYHFARMSTSTPL